MISDKLVKACGMREASNIHDAERLKVDMTGPIFYSKSPHCLREPLAYMSGMARRAGVFANEDKKEIGILVNRFSLDYTQLHGNESPEYCYSLRSTGLRSIKAFSVARRKDFENTGAYEKSCNHFLFDVKCEQHGGSGSQFDWTMLNSYKGKKPLLLSDGASPYSAPTLKELHHPQLAGLDLNSRFGARPGLKEIERPKFFLE